MQYRFHVTFKVLRSTTQQLFVGIKMTLETTTQNKRRLAEKRTLETATQRKRRLAKKRQKLKEKCSGWTNDEIVERKTKRRLYMKQYRASQSEEDRVARLQQMKQHRAEYRASQSEEDRAARLQHMRQHSAELRASQSEEDRAARLQHMRQHSAEYRASQSERDRLIRLLQMRQRNAEARRLNRASITGFMQSINTFCDKICDICTKRCYQNQISKWIVDTKSAPYLPSELKQTNCLMVCKRCKTHLSSKKNFAPSRSYWNNLDPGSVPNVIAELSHAEQRLISRIIPFVKIIKLSGVFGQYSFRGQAVLFAQDVFEVTENLANMLPRAANNAGIVVITERLENISITRQFSISKQKVYDALNWLILNNPLYKYVTVDQNVVIEENDIIRVEDAPAEIAVETDDEPTEDASAYMKISDSSRIVRASWHQSNDLIFTSGFAGVQCCAMALANILRASILSPQHWSTNLLNLNMITGDQIYSIIRFQTERKFAAHPIENDGYLLVRNFTVIQDDLVAFGKRLQITFDEEPGIFGSLNDKLNERNLGSTLRQGLEDMFMVYNASILTTEGYSFGVMHYNNKYYFSNSHSCGQKGAKAKGNNGKACVIDNDNLDEFVRICKRTAGSKNVQFTLDYINVEVLYKHDDSKEVETRESSEMVAAVSQKLISKERKINKE